MSRLAANPEFVAGAGGQAAPTAAMARALTVSGDLWIDSASSRVVESDLHIASTADPADLADVTVTARDPDGSVSLDLPASSVDVPLGTLISQVMKLMGKGTES